MAIASLFRFHHLDAENSPQPTRETQPHEGLCYETYGSQVTYPSTTRDIGGSSRINCQTSPKLQLLGSHVSPLDDLAAGIMVKNHPDWNLLIRRLIPFMDLTTRVPNNLVSGKSPKFLGFHEWCSSGILR